MQLLSANHTRYVLLVVSDGFDMIDQCAEVVRCPTTEAAAAALDSGRRYSAVIAPNPDPGLAAAARRAAVPVVSTWPPTAPALASALADVALPVPRADTGLSLGPALTPGPARQPAGARLLGQAWQPAAGHKSDADGVGRLVTVCGPGGTGTSVLAAALAVDLARPGVQTLLADLALRADQAFLHGLGEPPGGLFDLVGVARYRPATSADVRRNTLPAAGGRLLPGLRRAHHWTAVSPAAFDTVLAALRQESDLVVADVTGDLEGERESGSIDVEERNHMSRRATAAADAVVVVGAPGGNGIRRLAALVDDLLDHGIDPARIVPVVNRSPTDDPPPRVCGLPAPTIGVAALGGVEGALLPPLTAAPVASGIAHLLSAPPPGPSHPPLVAVAPGSLGCRGW